MHDVLPPYRLVLGPGVAIDPRVPQNCIRTGPPWCSTSSVSLSIHKAASLQTSGPMCSGIFARSTLSFIDTARTGELLSRLTADTTQMKAAFGATAAVALRNFFLFVGAIALMVYTSPKLSAAVLIAIPVIVLPLVASGRLVRKRSRTAQDTLAEASAYAAENLAAVRVMQAFGAEPATGRRFGAAVEEAYAAARNAALARAILTIIVIFLVFASIVGVLWFGAQEVLAGRMTGGLLSQFVLYAILAAGALSELSQVWGEIAAAGGSRRPDRRNSCRATEDRRARQTRRAARAEPRRDRLRQCHLRLSDKAARTPPCTACHSRSRPEKWSPSSDRPGLARRRCSSFSRASTIPLLAKSCSMASTSRAPIRRSCGGGSRAFRKTR